MLSQERLWDVLWYCQNTGRFIWQRPARASMAGKEAGTTNTQGYIQICVDGKIYPAHRLAWFYMTGTWPAKLVDHINCDRLDNSWINLREATCSENSRNSKHRVTSSSPYKNVSRHKKTWQVQVAGHHWVCSTLEEAVKLAHKMREHYHGEFANHGDTK